MATPDLEDPNFDGTVVLLLEHGPGGALGVVLNRPSPLPVGEAMTAGPAGPGTSWSDLATTPDVVFVGGPVQPNAVIALARVPEVSDNERWEPVFGDVGQRMRFAYSPATRDGASSSWNRRSTPAPGSWSMRTLATGSPPTPSCCGGPCCAGRVDCS